jgi:hypothetical protein
MQVLGQGLPVSLSHLLTLVGAAVAADELVEPFDVVVPVGRSYERRTYPT